MRCWHFFFLWNFLHSNIFSYGCRSYSLKFNYFWKTSFSFLNSAYVSRHLKFNLDSKNTDVAIYLFWGTLIYGSFSYSICIIIFIIIQLSVKIRLKLISIISIHGKIISHLITPLTRIGNDYVHEMILLSLFSLYVYTVERW